MTILHASKSPSNISSQLQTVWTKEEISTFNKIYWVATIFSLFRLIILNMNLEMAADECKLPNHTPHRQPFFHLFIYGLLCWTFRQSFFCFFAFHQRKWKCFDAFNHNTHQALVSANKSPFFISFLLTRKSFSFII